MIKWKLSNLFTPSLTKRFAMSNFEGRKTKDLQLDNEGDVSIWEDGIPTGIIDGWKVNSLYKTLIEVLQIGQYQNTEAVSMIEDVIKQNDEESEMFWNPNSCIMKDSHSYEEVDNCTSEIELKALYLWRTTRLSLSSIAFEVGAKLEDVATYVATYKKRVRQQLKSNKIRATQSRKVINNLEIEQVKGYWQSNSHKPLRISDIITSVWNQQGSKTPWHSTVSKVLNCINNIYDLFSSSLNSSFFSFKLSTFKGNAFAGFLLTISFADLFNRWVAFSFVTILYDLECKAYTFGSLHFLFLYRSQY